jgi:hypothetical protein
MRSHPLPWLLLVLALLPACSLLLDFDPEGQPCNAQRQCLPEYVCRDGGCVASPGAGTDGGTGARSLCEDPAGCPEPPAELH